MKNLLTAAMLIVCFQAQAEFIYDVTFTGLSAGASGGVATVTFNDNAFDTDGVFDVSSGLSNLDVMLEGFSFTFGDMSLSSQTDYEVLGGQLAGFDWSADNGFALLGGGSLDTSMASSLAMPMNLFSLFAPCAIGICEYSQSWVRRDTGMTVSEPATALLVGIGMLGLGLRRLAPCNPR